MKGMKGAKYSGGGWLSGFKRPEPAISGYPTGVLARAINGQIG
jgi:hypothetical protein